MAGAARAQLASLAAQFAVMLAVNGLLVVALILGEYALGFGEDVPLPLFGFFLFLISILVVLFDRYHFVYRARWYLQRIRRTGEEPAPELLDAAGLTRKELLGMARA